MLVPAGRETPSSTAKIRDRVKSRKVAAIGDDGLSLGRRKGSTNRRQIVEPVLNHGVVGTNSDDRVLSPSGPLIHRLDCG